MMYIASNCIKMKKRITISLSEESYIKLQLLAKKKKWSLSKTVEDILERQIAKQKQNVKKSDSCDYSTNPC